MTEKEVFDRIERAKGVGWKFAYDCVMMCGHPLLYGTRPDGSFAPMPNVGWRTHTPEQWAEELDEAGVPA